MVWREERVGGLAIGRCDLLTAVPGIAHAFSTRVADGALDFDLAARDGEAWDRFLAAAGLGRSRVARPRQVHGARVARAAVAAEEADAVLAVLDEDRRLAPTVVVADCVPILVAERGGKALAAIHAGWRGTAAGVAAAAVERLGRLGAPAADLVAVLGPAIGPCCYEVGGDVERSIAAACGAAQAAIPRPGRVDLRAANRAQLVAAGVPERAISCCPWCTACDPGRRFWSYRRDGAGAGRMAASLGWG